MNVSQHRSLNPWLYICSESKAEDLIRLLYEITSSSPKVIMASTEQDRLDNSTKHMFHMDSFHEKLGCVIDSLTNACEMLSFRSVKKSDFKTYKRSSSLPPEVYFGETDFGFLRHEISSGSIRRQKMNKTCESSSTIYSTELSCMAQSDFSVYIRKIGGEGDGYDCNEFEAESISGVSSISYPSCFDGMSSNSEDIVHNEMEYNDDGSIFEQSTFKLDLSLSQSEDDETNMFKTRSQCKDDETNIFKSRSKDSLLSCEQKGHNNDINDFLSVMSDVHNKDNEEIPTNLIQSLCSDDFSSVQELSKD